MPRVKDPTEYNEYIQAIVNDLSIDEVKVSWRASMKASVAGTAYPNNHVYLLKNPENVYEFESVEHLRYEVLRTIAHELRHVYQFQNKKLAIEVTKNGTRWKWDGVTMPATHISRKGVPEGYNQQPWEDDANTYAKEAINKYKHLVKGVK